jgi:hypothetical protein
VKVTEIASLSNVELCLATCERQFDLTVGRLIQKLFSRVHGFRWPAGGRGRRIAYSV